MANTTDLGLYPLFSCEPVEILRVCSLAHAMDDNMGAKVLIWDKERAALFVRAVEGPPRWMDVESGKLFFKRGPEIVEDDQ